MTSRSDCLTRGPGHIGHRVTNAWGLSGRLQKVSHTYLTMSSNRGEETKIHHCGMHLFYVLLAGSEGGLWRLEWSNHLFARGFTGERRQMGTKVANSFLLLPLLLWRLGGPSSPTFRLREKYVPNLWCFNANLGAGNCGRIWPKNYRSLGAVGVFLANVLPTT